MAKTYNVGRLSVEMVADTVQYVQKLKSAEATTKTSQTNIRGEMEKTRKKAKTASKDVDELQSTMKKLGEVATFINGPMGGVASRITSLTSIMGGTGGAIALTGGLTLAIAAGTAVALSASMAHAEQYKELKVYSDLAGVTVREMQLLSSATETVGVSTEKFGDITKDVQDKLGDYVATGGGEFANVFDTLGDKIGHSAEELQAMSGPDALEAVAHAMELANIPMDQQIFLMESIANDSSKLISLYADNSSELNNLKHQTELLTRSMDDELDVYNELSKEMDRAKSNMSDLIADAMTPMATSIESVTEKFNFFLASMEEGSEAARQYRMQEIQEEMEDTKKTIENATTAYGRFKNALTLDISDIEYQKKILQTLQDEYDALLEKGSQSEEPVDTPEAQYSNALYAGPDLAAIQEQNKTIAALEAQRLKQKKESDAALKKANSDANKAKAAADKQALEDDQEFINAANALREGYLQDQTDLYDLQKMALSGPSESDNGTDNTLALLQLNNERELELLKQQYAHKTELENEYQAAMKASKTQYYSDVLEAHTSSVNAEIALYKSIATGIGDQISALAGATDEEKEALTNQFLLKQALAVADATLAYYTTLSAHEATAATLGVAGSGYLAAQTGIASANYTKNLAGIAAVTVGGLAAGQFHSGTDSVPSEGSYLLQQGERVIQPKANQDLTEFMANGNSGSTEISAPLTIQGNVTDQKWFSEQLVHHRNTIAASVAKVDRERPMSKRRRG